MEHIIRAQLAAARASIDAAEALLAAWANGPEGVPVEEPAQDGICRHAPGDRKPIPTHGKPKAWLCLKCGFQHDGETPDA